MGFAAALATALVFVWTGMLLAISFLETPLKFRAPDVTLRIGLGIGRLVFRALNAVESLLAVALLAAVFAGDVRTGAETAVVVAAALLAAQVGLVRPRLSRRSDRVLAGEDAPRSHAHYVYVAAEVGKLAALLTAGALLLSG
jgi:hypothetical protein